MRVNHPARFRHPRPEATPAVPAPPPPDPASSAAPRLPAFSWRAPLGSTLAVRDALESVVATLKRTRASAASCAVANGLFVPLHGTVKVGAYSPPWRFGPFPMCTCW